MDARYAQEAGDGLRWFVWACWPDGDAHLLSAHVSLNGALGDASASLCPAEAQGAVVSICEGSALVMTNGRRA